MVLAASPALGARYGLLVGVSEYPALGPRYQLYGPANDVVLMREVLVQRGFRESDIRILAENVESAAEPTYQHIVDELARLTDKAVAGDFVYLHFSGHGSQQVDPPDDGDEERNGLDEIFLAKDVDKWPEKQGIAKNVLVDDQVNEFVTTLSDKGVNVWLVFDSCHSSTMLRGEPPDGIRDRSVPLDVLGLAVAESGEQRSRGGTNGGGATQALELGDEDRVVALYAAETDQQTPEMKLPVGDPSRQSYGLLTYHLAGILGAAPPGISYRQVGQQLLQNYAAAGMFTSTPLIDGPLQEQSIFDEPRGEPVRQWRIREDDDGVWIGAGRLNGIGDAATFALMPEAVSPDEDKRAILTAAEVDVFRTRLDVVESDAGEGTETPSLEETPGMYARLLASEPRLSLAVTRPALPDNPAAAQLAAMDALEALSARAEEGGVTWLPPDEMGDVTLRFRDDSLLILDSAAGVTEDPVVVDLDPDERVMTTRLAEALQTVSNAYKLLRLVPTFDRGTGGLGLETTLTRIPKGEDTEIVVDASRLPEFVDGDRLKLTVRNNGTHRLDITVLFLDARYGVLVFLPAPEHGLLPRLGPGQQLSRSATINAETRGVEKFLVIAVRADKGSQPADFSYLAQKPLPGRNSGRARGGGDDNGALVDESNDESFASISQLLERAAFGGQRKRGIEAEAPAAQHAAMELLQLRVQASDTP